MRVRFDVTTSAVELPWRSVLAPGRGLVYDLLAEASPGLGNTLHEHGWGPYGMVPFGFGAPIFPAAPRRRGAYAVGGRGYLELGSPLPEVVEACSQALSGRRLIDWGGAALRLVGLEVVEAPRWVSGRATMRTSAPVVLKVPGSQAAASGGTAWVLPTEPQFVDCFVHNLRRKALTMGVDPDVEVEAVTWVGPKRSFAVGAGVKPGAAVEVALRGAPQTLRMIWSWGFGQANAAGFGWIGAAR